MNIDAECKAALDRLKASMDARFARFDHYSRRQNDFAMRSVAQKARRLRELTAREFAVLRGL